MTVNIVISNCRFYTATMGNVVVGRPVILHGDPHTLMADGTSNDTLALEAWANGDPVYWPDGSRVGDKIEGKVFGVEGMVHLETRRKIAIHNCEFRSLGLRDVWKLEKGDVVREPEAVGENEFIAFDGHAVRGRVMIEILGGMGLKPRYDLGTYAHSYDTRHLTPDQHDLVRWELQRRIILGG
jgi:hypothetical protein